MMKHGLVKKFNGVLIVGTKAAQAAELMFLIIAIVGSLHYGIFFLKIRYVNWFLTWQINLFIY